MSVQHYLENAHERFWRTDLRLGRNVYVLLSNDPNRPSPADLLIGTMETSVIAETVVDTHNKLLIKFGKRYPRVLETLE
jgi:hypothetical protein